MEHKEILSSFLPSGLLEHFQITDFKELGHIATKTDSYYLLSLHRTNFVQNKSGVVLSIRGQIPK